MSPAKAHDPRAAWTSSPPREAHAENARTQELVLELAGRINLRGGYVLAPELETRSLFSHVDLRGKRVLELGCGTLPVTIAVPAVEQTRLFLATDVSLEIVRAAGRVDGRPRYAVFSAAQPAITPGSVDLVVLNQVLHHMPPDCDLLGVVRGLLAPGGQVLVLEPNTSCLPGRLVKWLLKRWFGLVMEASPYGQFAPATIARLVSEARLHVRKGWFASLLAFPLTGGLGRVRVVPDSRRLFRLLVWIDETISRLLRPVPALGRLLHWRVLYLLERDDAAPGSA